MISPHSSMSRRELLAAAASTAVGLSLVGNHHYAARAAEKVTLALDWYPNANHAGIFQAQADGLFANAGLDLELYTPSDPTVILQTVGAGRDTFGISYQTDVLLARAQGVPIVSIAALVQHPLVCVMSLSTKGITKPSDLKGKTVGYPGIPSQEAFLATMLESDGLTLADIELVNVEFNLLPALISGQADAVMGAYWTHETILAEKEGYPVDILRVEDWGVPDYYELVLVANEETISNHPDMITAFLSAVQAGYASTIADPGKSLEHLLTANPEIDRSVEEAGLALLIPAWMDGAAFFGEQKSTRWTSYAEWMVARELIPATLDVAAAFSTDFVPASPATATAGQ